VERCIGEAGHKIHSKKEPFANLTNIIIELEVSRILGLYYPNLAPRAIAAGLSTSVPDLRVAQKLKFSASDAELPEFRLHIRAIESVIGRLGNEACIERFGKLRLANGQTLRSRYSEAISTTKRHYRWFQVRCHFRAVLGSKFRPDPQASSDDHDNNNSPASTLIFGEALAFYTVPVAGNDSLRHCLMVFRPLCAVEQLLKTVVRGKWPLQETQISAMDAGRIHEIVGIWESDRSENVYILRKHPSLLSLAPIQRGLEDEMDREDAYDDDRQND
jgi:hypothetical protein